jgi:hypothetical protein
MPILDETNKTVVLRYAAQGTRILLGFIIVLTAKRGGILSDVGRMINLSSIYSMIALASLIPFMKSIWIKFRFWTVLRFVVIFQIICLIIPYLLYVKIAEIWLYWFLFSYVLSAILMQYIQDYSERNAMVVPVVQILANVAAGLFLIFSSNLIFIYFLPYQITLGAALILLRRSDNDSVRLGLGEVKTFLLRIIGLGMLLSVAWPLTFYFLRENQVALNRVSWEELEFILRIGLSCAGITISVVLNYNVVTVISSFSQLINKVKEYLLYIVPIFVLGLIVGYVEVSNEFYIDLSLILLAFFIKTIGAFGSFSLINSERLLLVVLVEIFINAIFYFGILYGFSSGLVFLSGSLIQTCILYVICRKTFI